MLGLQRPDKYRFSFSKDWKKYKDVLTRSGTAFVLHVVAVKAVLTLATPLKESTVSIDNGAPEAVDWTTAVATIVLPSPSIIIIILKSTRIVVVSISSWTTPHANESLFNTVDLQKPDGALDKSLARVVSLEFVLTCCCCYWKREKKRKRLRNENIKKVKKIWSYKFNLF